MLHDIGLSDEELQIRTIEVWNKSDRLEEGSRAKSLPVECSQSYPVTRPEDSALIPRLHVSAVNGRNLSGLKDVMEMKLRVMYENKKWAPDWVKQ